VQTWQIITLAVLVVGAALVVVALVSDRKRRQHLRDHFGAEYDRTVAEFGDRRRAESELGQREDHVRKLRIRSLNASDRQKFSEDWRRCQARFVDDPVGAVRQADDLVTDIMRARGYTFSNHHERMADISAAYPSHVAHCRLAETIVMRSLDEPSIPKQASLQEAPSTDELRNAFVHYRALFDEMLEEKDEEHKRAS